MRPSSVVGFAQVVQIVLQLKPVINKHIKLFITIVHIASELLYVFVLKINLQHQIFLIG
jgi:hypothetical protein